MAGTGEIKYPGGKKLALLPGSLISTYQGLEEENLGQKLPGPPGWGLLQQTSPRSSLKNKKCKKKKTPNIKPRMEG